jgi:hypothetical protein
MLVIIINAEIVFYTYFIIIFINKSEILVFKYDENFQKIILPS